jgi:hypothetical protein
LLIRWFRRVGALGVGFFIALLSALPIFYVRRPQLRFATVAFGVL